jgi:hypothetical protein
LAYSRGREREIIIPEWLSEEFIDGVEGEEFVSNKQFDGSSTTKYHKLNAPNPLINVFHSVFRWHYYCQLFWLKFQS